MGLSNFPSPAEGMLPLLVMNAVMSMARAKNKLRSALRVVGGGGGLDSEDEVCRDGSSERRVSITRYSSLCRNRCMCGRRGCVSGGGGGEWVPAECCVCLCRFEGGEEVSELSCKHFFHKGCLEKWFHNHHISCPLCRSTM